MNTARTRHPSGNTPTLEPHNNDTERLRKNGVISLMDMERLLDLLEKKSKDIALIKSLLSAVETKKRVMSLDDLKGVMEEGVFTRVCKGVIQ